MHVFVVVLVVDVLRMHTAKPPTTIEVNGYEKKTAKSLKSLNHFVHFIYKIDHERAM